jgi:hypothetical protein
MQIIPSRQRAISALRPPIRQANFALWPGGKFRLLANVQFLHSGGLRAKSAPQENANFARLLRAEIARDSYDYLRVFF